MLAPCLHIVLQHIFLLYVAEHLSEILPAGCYKTALKEDHGTLYHFCNLISHRDVDGADSDGALDVHIVAASGQL